MDPNHLPDPGHDLMRGHAERVARYEATFGRASARIQQRHADLVAASAQRRTRRPVSAEARQFTGAQRLRRWKADSDMALNRRVSESPLWDGIPRSRQSWSSRLRELELHPERVGRIRDRIPKAHREAVILDEVTA